MKSTAFAAFAICLLAGGSLRAGIITSADIASGAHSVTIPADGTVLTAWDVSGRSGVFGKKTVGGLTGFGVQGGASGNEIDVGQWIRVEFTAPVIIDRIDLGAIFNGPEFGDPKEKAKIKAILAGGDRISGIFTVTGEDIATWTLPGASISNFGATTSSGAGAFHLDDPFGGDLVVGLIFKAIDSPTSTNNSDYTILGIETSSPVPEPATLALAGLGAAALGIARRRSRS